MLLEARRAGDALIAAKRLVRHGEFKAWIKAHCRCSYETASGYMKVAKLSGKNVDLDTFQGGVDAFLEAHAKPRETPPEPTQEAPAPFTRADAEYALKLAAMAERGATEHEVTSMTTSVTLTTRGGLAWADSREVAKSFEKSHRHVLREVDAILIQRPDLGGVYFQEVSAPHPTVANTLIRHFEMTRDGFSLLAMGWTGAKALAFKVAYIDRFNAMEAALKAEAKPTLPDFSNPAIAARAWAVLCRVPDRVPEVRDWDRRPLQAGLTNYPHH